ncbi:hypothetical protein FDECE_10750 [Fusarium decemcellulare]|nr:hypothetical protein FDECE_10750 [Fusarium decemcellulare]
MTPPFQADMPDDNLDDFIMAGPTFMPGTIAADCSDLLTGDAWDTTLEDCEDIDYSKINFDSPNVLDPQFFHDDVLPIDPQLFEQTAQQSVHSEPIEDVLPAAENKAKTPQENLDDALQQMLPKTEVKEDIIIDPYEPSPQQSYLPPCVYPEAGLDGTQQAHPYPLLFHPLLYPNIPPPPPEAMQWLQQVYPGLAGPMHPQLPNPAYQYGLTNAFYQPPPQVPAPLPKTMPVKRRARTSSEVSDPFRFETKPSHKFVVQHKRTLKQTKDPDCDPTQFYTSPLPLVQNWRKNGDDDAPHFIYTSAGQWEDDFVLSKSDVKHYVKDCPRQLRIWLQHCPAQSNHRMDTRDRKCRYAHCPVTTRSIRPGFFRVAFDEYYQLTSNGTKDPFKVAGVMHLWCFEQCMDVCELIRQRVMHPDTRTFPKESKNPMLLTRDSDSGIISGALRPWVQETSAHNKEYGLQLPRVHEDTLSYRLTRHHIDFQVNARQSVREKRNSKRPQSSKKTIDWHMGDLAKWVKKDKEVTAKRQDNKSVPYLNDFKPDLTEDAVYQPYNSQMVEAPIMDPAAAGIQQPELYGQTTAERFPTPLSPMLPLESIQVQPDFNMLALPGFAVPEIVVPEVQTQKRRRSTVEDEDGSLFGSPKSKRSRSSTSSRGSGRSSQGASLRRSSRVSAQKTP